MSDSETANDTNADATTHVVAVCGSLREHSYTRFGLGVALEGVREAGGTGDLLDLREFDLPPLNADLDEQGDAAEFAEHLRRADAVLLGTPMYHGSYSGVLKNALDHVGFDEFEGKTVGLLTVAGGSFPVTALEHLRSVCRALDAWVLPHQVAIPRASRAFEGGEVVDDGIRERARVLGERAVRFAHIEADPRTFESGENVGGDR